MGISRQQALECLRSNDLIGIGMEADAVRRRLHPEGVVSYALEGAVSMPDGMRAEGNAGEASHQRLYDEICQTIGLGSTCVRLIGGLDSEPMNSRIEWFVGVVRGIRRRFPSLWIEGLSAAEIVARAAGSGFELRETIARLRDAGLDSIAGIDSQPQCSVAEWIAVHRAAHGLGMRTVAALHFGTGETLEQRVDLLEAIRRLQEETGGFAAFIPAPAEAPDGRELDAVTAVEQLKTLAVARVFLDNIENIQWSGSAQGLKVLQLGLRFGANDAGSVTPEGIGAKFGNGAGAGSGENSPVTEDRITEEDLRRIIRDAGFQPVQRDTPYRTMFLN
jgi:cyclic dehypoxanthinyl futalosine synthase